MYKIIKILLFLLLNLFLYSCSTSDKSVKTQTTIISTLMQEQENCWNKGDLNCFMQHYWNSDSLMFIGSSGVNYGWQTTLNNYKRSYKDKSEMGTLTFNNLSIKPLSDNYIHVVGKWHLERLKPLKDLEGHYTLVWKKINGKWLIISDHSS